MKPYAYILRSIADYANVKSIKQIAMQPGVQSAYRVTLHHQDMRAADAVVSVVQKASGELQLEAVYQGRFSNRPLQRALPEQDFKSWVLLLREIGFDHLDDYEDIPLTEADLCMVERAAGGFAKSVIFVPQKAEADFAKLLDAIQLYLPEALREIR